jgi:hypothetical protein
MRYSEPTNINPILEVKSRYCQLLLEDMYFPYLETEGFRSDKSMKWPRDLSQVSTTVYEFYNTGRNFRIVGRVFERFCDNLALSVEEQKWTFDNLTGILWGGQSSGEHLRFVPKLLKNIYDKIFMYYLGTSGLRSSKEYSESDVNLYEGVLIKALTMANLSMNTSLITWLAGIAETRRSVLSDDSTSERIQQVLEKPWKEIQQTYLKILSELRTMSAIHLEKLSQIPSEVLYFCFQQEILQHLPITIEIIEKSFFTTIDKVEMAPEIDPETGEEWLDFKIRIKGEVKEVLDRYDKYTEYSISSLPWSSRYKMRLSYKII